MNLRPWLRLFRATMACLAARDIAVRTRSPRDLQILFDRLDALADAMEDCAVMVPTEKQPPPGLFPPAGGGGS